ncbi:NIPSNAP family protein [Pusillimonas noertemannii]|uniref:NIPSNAP protein n=1 Tax=Pusillimonas noertemannii TaxID=305977 RepID=A0A2U1CK58_9BURK|nr:NIPSNAP family protein [Pusillimonas noertemannii]NYT69708.1 NIPSNAP family protein [Pusillimonas noertemannii]PVY61368.1 NIPSNAP protein [Pusillimonas noertemannii]TFL09023.1 NIPSNAP family protein [Pusillimonas noertemannii]
MIVDHRTYIIRTGLMRDFLALYAAEGLAVQTEHLGTPLGYYTTEVGELNQVVHLWAYTDMADRQRRRAALEADPRWLAYRRKAAAAGQVLRQSNAILQQVDFTAFASKP